MDLIVARYNEDLNWTDEVQADRKFLYNKGGVDPRFIPLPNKGREAHTFFFHIFQNYDSLADINVFVQGNPFDHTPNLRQILECNTLDEISTKIKEVYPGNHSNEQYVPLGVNWMYNMNDVEWDIDWRDPHIEHVYKRLYAIKPPQSFVATWGGQMAVTKKAIHMYSRGFYEYMWGYATRRVNWSLPWAMEVLWLDILSKTRKMYA